MSFIQFESTWRFPVCLPGKRTPTCQSDNILCLYFVTEWIFRTVLHYFQKFPTVLMWCRLKKKVVLLPLVISDNFRACNNHLIFYAICDAPGHFSSVGKL